MPTDQKQAGGKIDRSAPKVAYDPGRPSRPDPRLTSVEQTRRLFEGAIGFTEPDIPATGVPPGFSEPPNDPDQLPNYEQLTGVERWVMNRLPGISNTLKPFLEHPAVQWAGKILSKLDIPVEGLERSVGFVSQWAASLGDPAQHEEFKRNMKAAWYAGALAADFADTTLDYKADQGLFVPHDLPGMNGLVEARLQIADLTAQGVSYGDALAQVRDQEYTSAGALALRSQMQDAFFHIFADPINVVLPMLKPVERLHLAAIRATTTGATAATVVELGQGAEKAASALADAERALELAQTAGKAEDIATATQKVADAQAGLEAAQKILAQAQEARLTPWQELIVRVTNADPTSPDYLKRNPFNPFALTPQSKAIKYVNDIVDNISSYVVQAATRNGVFDPDLFTRIIQRAHDGAIGPELGHMLVSIQGRQALAIYKQMTAIANDSLLAWRATSAVDRPFLQLVAEALGETDVGVIRKIADGSHDALLLQKLEAAVAESSDFAARLARLSDNTGRTPQQLLARLAALVGGETDPMKIVPLTPDLFKLQALNKVADAAARQGIAMYGVKAQGLLTSASNALKAAETLAFLRLNPAYPIRNWVNNTLTLVARGAFGTMTGSQIDAFWAKMGFEPARLRQGMSMAEIPLEGQAKLAEVSRRASSAALGHAQQTISDVVRGEKGWLRRVEDFFREMNLGKADFGKWAAEFEAGASKQAFTSYFMRGYRDFYRAGGPFLKKLADFDPVALRQVGDAVARDIQRAVASATTPDELRALTQADNLKLNIENVLARAREKSGLNFDYILGREFTESISDGLLGAAKKGEGALADYMAGLSDTIAKHLDDALDKSIDTLRQETAAQVKAQGPGRFTALFAEVNDEFWAAHEQHALDIAELTDRIRRASDPDIVDALWRKNAGDSDAFYGRFWTRYEARIRGFGEAAKELKLAGADAVLANFQAWRGGWQKFFKHRETVLNRFFERLKEKAVQTGEWDGIVADLNARYAAQVKAEDIFTRRVDDTLAGFLPTEQQGLFRAYRGAVAKLRADDRALVQQFRESLQNIPASQLEEAWKVHWDARRRKWNEIRNIEQAGKAAMQGDPNARALFEQAATPQAGAAQAAGQTPPEGVSQTPPPAFSAPDTTAGAPVAPTGPAEPQVRDTFLPDVEELVKPEMYLGTGIDQLWYTRGRHALSSIHEAAAEIAAEAPLRWADIPDTAQASVRAYVSHAETAMADARLAAIKFGEFGRDSALLNYNRRFNYNTWLGVGAPYEFWATQSAWKWALHSLDRPAMLTTYFRMKHFLDTAYRPSEGLPSRLRGSLRIPLPFLPDWMGDEVFIDPLRMALPFEGWASPWERAAQEEYNDIGTTRRKLAEMLEDGQITQAEHDEAAASQGGAAWDRAFAEVANDDAEGRLQPLDFVTQFVNPHLPLAWAFNKAGLTSGTVDPLSIPPVRNLNLSIASVQAILGIDPAGGLNVVAATRKALGLHPFDEWDDYRSERMLANMVATGEISVEDALRGQIDHQGPAWDEAKRKMALETFGSWLPGSLMGLPVKFYPEGEENLRELSNEYAAAKQEYDRTGDYESSYGNFFEKFPEYEARLALYKSPEERLQTFLIDEMWSRYNDMPALHRQEVREQLGSFFEQAFLSKDTRSYSAIPLETLAAWVKVMGGDPPGTLNYRAEKVPPLDLAPADVAKRAQDFYGLRDLWFPDWRDESDAYFSLEEGGARRAYKRAHPEFDEYMDWRWDFLKRNPDVAPYLTDNPPKYRSESEIPQAGPNLTAGEWRQLLGDPLYRLVDDYNFGEDLPAVARTRLVPIAAGYGLEVEDLAARIGAAP